MNHTDTHPTDRLPRALLLHADAAIAERLRRALEAGRFSVVSARDGEAGLALLLEELLELDVLVIAADLPGRDARSFAELVRRAGGERDLALVVLASEPSRDARTELLALGVDAVVDASAGPAAIAEAARAAVAARRRERDHATAPRRWTRELEPVVAPTAWWALPFARLALRAA